MTIMMRKTGTITAALLDSPKVSTRRTCNGSTRLRKRSSDGETASLAFTYLVLAVRAGVVGVARAAHILRLDAHAAVLALADQRLRLWTALG